MPTGLEEEFETYDELLGDFEVALEEFNKLSPSSKKKQIFYCSRLIQQITTAKEGILVEAGGSDLSLYEDDLKERDIRFASLMSGYEWKKAEVRRDKILDDTERLAEIDPNTLTRDEVIAHGDVLQDKTQEALDRIANLAKDAEEIGVNVGVALNAQGQKIKQLHGDVDTIDDNLSNAKRTIRSFVRNMGRDLVSTWLAIFLILIIAAIIFIALI